MNAKINFAHCRISVIFQPHFPFRAFSFSEIMLEQNATGEKREISKGLHYWPCHDFGG
jgi:hypothetical protein